MYFEEREPYILEDDYVYKRQGELRREMYAHLILGACGGVLATLSIFFILVWLAGV